MARVEIVQQNGYDFLWINKEGDRPYLWMWDIPVERQAQQQLAERAYGKVLVAGYGLGVVQELLVKNPLVERVVTCELEPEVIKANKLANRPLQGEIVLADFLNFESREQFDCVIGDIWKDITPEEEDVAMYKLFRDKGLSLVKPGGKVLAWGMDYFEYLLEKRPTQDQLDVLTKSNGN